MLDHVSADQGLDQIRAATDEVKGKDRYGGKAAENKGQRHAECPYEATVEQKSYHGLSAGTQRKIGGICVAIEGQENSSDADQTGGQMLDGVGSIIDLGE